MKIVFFGLSITSAWGNGHATTFRALIKGLHELGHDVIFYEKNLKWYESNRDLPSPDFCKVLIFDSWSAERKGIQRELRSADAVIVGSYFPEGATVIDEVLESGARVKAFYDIDTPITIAQLESEGSTPYLAKSQIPELDIYFSFTAGPLLTKIARQFGARRTQALFCSVDPAHYFRRPPAKRFTCDLSYMGTYAPDRQPKLEAWFNSVATEASAKRFIIAGPQYPRTVVWAKNVRHTKHLNPRWHPHLYSSSRFVLNLTRRDMVLAGYSPSVRLFEAAACAAAIISDNWPGLEDLFSPGKEILLPAGSEDVLTYLRQMSDAEIRSIGEAAQARVLECHTNLRRAEQFERAIEEARVPRCHEEEPATNVRRASELIA